MMDSQSSPPTPAPPKKTGAYLAAFSFGFAILAFVKYGFFLGVPAVIFGWSAILRMRTVAAAQVLKPFAVLGIILGAWATILSVLSIIFKLAFLRFFFSLFSF